MEEETCPKCKKQTLLVFANHGIKDCHACGYSEDETKTIKCFSCGKTLFGEENGRQKLLEDIYGHGGKTYCTKCHEEEGKAKGENKHNNT